MEQNTPKFRLRLNLFDGIVLAAALIAAAVLAWFILNPTPTNKDDITEGTLRYTIRLTRWRDGTSSLVRVGDQLTDNIKDRPMGEIVDVQVEPCRIQTLDLEHHRQILAKIEGFDDVLVTVEAPCGINDYGVTIEEDDYPLRVGETAYVRGDGYMGSGAVESIQILETFEDGQEVGK